MEPVLPRTSERHDHRKSMHQETQVWPSQAPDAEGVEQVLRLAYAILVSDEVLNYMESAREAKGTARQEASAKPVRHDKKGEHSMSTEENKATGSRMLDEVIVGGNLALMDELIASDFVNHNVVGTGEESSSVGVENFRQEIRALRLAFPDLALSVIQLLADGDKIIAHLRVQATHLGEFGRIPATGRRIDVPSITIIRMANGKFAERWNLVDRYGLLQQLGVIASQ